ncbi:hypothetical protein SAMN02746062_01307 [Alysiella filiformis DSM 16848]|uniref:Surface-adhesin protein E-like domain-containing protein n=2 Tax=Alysiella TaxID=194195 RepID=A0A286ECB4_9NEIS|nr:hypothetical protein SAMN02746062_01307 [Alysiella filiformis DSM 16848]
MTETETTTRTTYSDLWTSAEVAADESIHTPPAATVNPDNDPNRILTSKTESGNREYLFADSIKQDNGKIMALIEYRYAHTQKLPSNGLLYTHNHWFEEIDCANKIRTVLTTTHYNAQGEIVDANEYPSPKLTPAQMKLLAQPDDGVIKEVCQRVGQNKPAAPAVSGNPTATPPSNPPTSTPNETGESPTANNPIAPQAASETAAPQPTPKENKRKKKDKNKPKPAEPTNNKNGEIDFIQKGKQETPTTQQPENPPANEVEEKGETETSSPTHHTAPAQDELPPDFWTIGAPKE